MEDNRPAGEPPVGVTPNFDNPPSVAGGIIACNVVLLIISLSVVGARFLSRTVLTTWRLGWDDYTILLATIGTVIFSGFVIQTTKYGLGKHIWDVKADTYDSGYRWWIMASFAACPASYYFVKLSILFLYLRVFDLQKKLRWIIYVLFAYSTIYYALAFAMIVGMCNTMNKVWDVKTTMNCFAYGPTILTIGGADVLCDILILAFPVPMLLRLQITTVQKLYLLLVFCIGITATAVCIARIVLGATAMRNTDATMAQARAVYCLALEHYLALIAACMPTLGPFFRLLQPSKFRSEAHKLPLVGSYFPTTNTNTTSTSSSLAKPHSLDTTTTTTTTSTTNNDRTSHSWTTAEARLQQKPLPQTPRHDTRPSTSTEMRMGMQTGRGVAGRITSPEDRVVNYFSHQRKDDEEGAGDRINVTRMFEVRSEAAKYRR